MYHRSNFRLIGIILCILLGVAGAKAQEDESVRFGIVQTKRPIELRVKPSGAASVIVTIPARTRLGWVAGQSKNGFVRVIIHRGAQGWVPAVATQLVSRPPTPAALMAAAVSCAPNLAACPVTGCSTPNSAHGLFNRIKRRMPGAGTSLPLTFTDFGSLQEQATSLVGQGEELPDDVRSTLRDLHVSQGMVQEGSLVRVTGFIAQGLDPHANRGESVNCNRTAVADNDFHISLAERPDQDEFAGIVVEMVPQGRSADWTLAKLKDIKDQGKRVLVVGAIFYDNAHVVNADPENPLQGQPRRFSLWEVHPIMKFFVCGRADNKCSLASLADWVPLESF